MHTDSRMLLATLLLTAVLPAAAGPVYSWTDPAGVTHFSELPPPPGYQAMQLDLPQYPAAAIPEDDYFSVINQAARMEARRLERERLEAERWQAEAEARRAQAEALAAREPAMPPPAPVNQLYLPWHPYRGYRSHHPRRHYPQREHHGSYPPYRPGYRHNAPDFSLNRPPAMRRPD